MLKLNPLKATGKIGILAPAFPADADKLRRGIEYLLQQGYELDLGDSLTARHGYFAGTDDIRLADLHRMFANPQIGAIICARGGWGTLRLLDKLDYDLIQKNPKPLVGYSDITFLHLALWQKAGLPGLSGPMVAVEMGSGILPFTSDHFWPQLTESNGLHVPLDTESVEIWQNGSVQGPLLGGCLSMVAHLLGTPYAPDFKDSILFLEDVGEEPYKIDRYLAHLRQAGVFDRIAGLILGDFVDCEDGNPARNSFSLRDVLYEYFANKPYPVIYNFPYGHGMKKIALPVGPVCRLETATGTLHLGSLFS